MKYLQKRNNFLSQLKEAQKYGIVGDEILLREVFENDITWGGSLLGRLINSSIRRFKIGFNQVKIDPLVRKLEDELNYLISASLQGDILKRYNELLIKSYFEQIKNVCLSNETEEGKLDELLGQHSGLYDPNDPTKNQKTLGIVQEAIDVITDDLKDLPKIIGTDRDELIDRLSDFNDDLRKLTVISGTPVQPSQSSATNFNLNFTNVLNATLSNQLVTSSISFDRLLSYELFMEKTDPRSIEYFKRQKEAKLAAKNKLNQEDNQVAVVNKNNQVVTTDKNNQVAVVSKNNQVDTTDKNNQVVVVNKNNNQVDTTKSQVSGKGTTGTKREPDIEDIDYEEVSKEEQGGKSLPNSNITKEEINKVLSILKNKDEQDVKKDQDVKNLLAKMAFNIKPAPKASKVKVKYGEEEVILKDAIDKLEHDIKESIVFIYEVNSGGFGNQPSGGTSSNNQGPTKKTVSNVWDEYKFDRDSSTTRLTQREVDELNSMLTKGTQDMKYEPEKRPDPIVSIARIFGEAHNLYYTDVIPSGRPNGRISQKTFREYYKLGKGTARYTSDSGPEGPFAIKSTFEKWKAGVEKLLQNQEYRKILANVKFVVPGAEDKFNDNYNTKIFEADFDKTDRSQGQILFQFINNMLDKTKLDDFDNLRSTLMSKYFGIKYTPKEKPKKIEKDPDQRDIDPNFVYWSVLQTHKMDVTKSKFYAIPIKKFVDPKGIQHDMMFLQLIRAERINNKNAYLIKFTYDDPVIMKKFAETKLSNMKYDDWKQKSSNRVFYGFINKTDLTNGSKFTIVFGNVNNSEVSQIYTREYIVDEGHRILEGGKTIDPKVSKFVYNDANAVKDIILPSGFEEKLMTNDKKTHSENLDKNVKNVNKTLIEALKDTYTSSNP